MPSVAYFPPGIGSAGTAGSSMLRPPEHQSSPSRAQPTPGRTSPLPPNFDRHDREITKNYHYDAFVTTSGYKVPAGLAHDPRVISIPGQWPYREGDRERAQKRYYCQAKQEKAGTTGDVAPRQLLQAPPIVTPATGTLFASPTSPGRPSGAGGRPSRNHFHGAAHVNDTSANLRRDLSTNRSSGRVSVEQRGPAAVSQQQPELELHMQPRLLAGKTTFLKPPMLQKVVLETGGNLSYASTPRSSFSRTSSRREIKQFSSSTSPAAARVVAPTSTPRPGNNAEMKDQNNNYKPLCQHLDVSRSPSRILAAENQIISHLEKQHESLRLTPRSSLKKDSSGSGVFSNKFSSSSRRLEVPKLKLKLTSCLSEQKFQFYCEEKDVVEPVGEEAVAAPAAASTTGVSNKPAFNVDQVVGHPVATAHDDEIPAAVPPRLSSTDNKPATSSSSSTDTATVKEPPVLPADAAAAADEDALASADKPRSSAPAVESRTSSHSKSAASSTSSPTSEDTTNGTKTGPTTTSIATSKTSSASATYDVLYEDEEEAYLRESNTSNRSNDCRRITSVTSTRSCVLLDNIIDPEVHEKAALIQQQKAPGQIGVDLLLQDEQTKGTTREDQNKTAATGEVLLAREINLVLVDHENPGRGRGSVFEDKIVGSEKVVQEINTNESGETNLQEEPYSTHEQPTTTLLEQETDRTRDTSTIAVVGSSGLRSSCGGVLQEHPFDESVVLEPSETRRRSTSTKPSTTKSKSEEVAAAAAVPADDNNSSSKLRPSAPKPMISHRMMKMCYEGMEKKSSTSAPASTTSLKSMEDTTTPLATGAAPPAQVAGIMPGKSDVLLPTSDDKFLPLRQTADDGDETEEDPALFKFKRPDRKCAFTPTSSTSSSSTLGVNFGCSTSMLSASKETVGQQQGALNEKATEARPLAQERSDGEAGKVERGIFLMEKQEPKKLTVAFAFPEDKDEKEAFLPPPATAPDPAEHVHDQNDEAPIVIDQFPPSTVPDPVDHKAILAKQAQAAKAKAVISGKKQLLDPVEFDFLRAKGRQRYGTSRYERKSSRWSANSSAQASTPLSSPRSEGSEEGGSTLLSG
ncbi:unnamed protein product, partial [Amoebophrya sp. A120]|eukprot:GSA120T00015723001.1